MTLWGMGRLLVMSPLVLLVTRLVASMTSGDGDHTASTLHPWRTQCMGSVVAVPACQTGWRFFFRSLIVARALTCPPIPVMLLTPLPEILPPQMFSSSVTRFILIYFSVPYLQLILVFAWCYTDLF